MRIKRIAHGQDVYEVGQPWPRESEVVTGKPSGTGNGGQPQTTSLVVGMINYTAAYEVETETEPNGFDDEGQPIGDPLKEREAAHYEAVRVPSELLALYVKIEPALLRGEWSEEIKVAVSTTLDRLDERHPQVIIRRIWRDRVAVQVEDRQEATRGFFLGLLNSLLDAVKAAKSAQPEAAAPS